MPKVIYPDNYKIEVVNHYRKHKCVKTTLDKYGIAKSTLFKWKKQYECSHFSQKEKAALLSPQARAHTSKVQEVMKAQKECRCPVTASVEEKMAAIQKLEDKYSIRVLCDAVQLPRGDLSPMSRISDICLSV